MKRLSVALAMLPFLATGPALAQEAFDPEMLSPSERALNMHPERNPEWTWMREDQAAAILRGHGYGLVLSLERSGAAWRGKAARNNESYHVALNRYAHVFGHLDKKGRSLRAPQGRGAMPLISPHAVISTLNGNVATSTSQMAPTGLTSGRPVATVMGEIGWTWMKENQAVKLLEKKGYARINNLRRDEQGIWRGKAVKNQVAVLVGIDLYGNTVDEPVGDGGVAQAGF
jgi:protein CpxP